MPNSDSFASFQRVLDTLPSLKVYHLKYGRGRIVHATTERVTIDFGPNGRYGFRMTEFLRDLRDANPRERMDDLHAGCASAGYSYRLHFVHPRPATVAPRPVIQSKTLSFRTKSNHCFNCCASLREIPGIACRGCAAIKCPECLFCFCDSRTWRKRGSSTGGYR